MVRNGNYYPKSPQVLLKPVYATTVHSWSKKPTDICYILTCTVESLCSTIRFPTMAALDRKHGEKSLDITAAAVHLFSFLKFVYYPYSSLAIRGRSCRIVFGIFISSTLVGCRKIKKNGWGIF